MSTLPTLVTLILSLSFFFLRSCDLLERKINARSASTFSPQKSIDIEAYKAVIRQSFQERKNYSPAVLPHLRYGDTLAAYYGKRNYEPIWTASGIAFGGLNAILTYFKLAGEDGLDPAWYHYTQLHDAIEHFTRTLKMGDTIDLKTLARIEILLSDGLMRYAFDIRFGILNPTQLDAEGYHLPYTKPNGYNLFAPIESRNIVSFLASVQPNDQRYIRLKQSLIQYRKNAAGIFAALIPALPPKTKIKLDDSSPILSAVAARIEAENSFNWISNSFFSASPVMRLLSLLDISPPILDREKVQAGKYDSTLFKLVRYYQAQNGLLDDGVIGAKTIEYLNRSAEDRINQLRINLDRCRWFQYPDTGEYVRVNIPEYYLYAKENGVTQYKIKVCVGERFRGWSIHGHSPMNYQTPLLTGKITYLVLNPTWNVPSSIATRETYYEIKKDPTYLLRHNYRMYRGDSLVNPSSINWAEINPRKIPFRFVQGAGRGNALGRIKFMFYNEFDVYLHDTPKRVPFTRGLRAVSHGCVRVENPYHLMKFVLKGHSTWTPAKIQAYLDQTHEGKVVFLEKKIPVYTDYVTAWVDDNGRIQFRDDVYGKDALLKKAMLSIR